MGEVPVPYWDLNFWVGDEGWSLTAYPYDEDDKPIGEHMAWVRIPLTSYEVSKLRLGHVGNRYSSDDDFWIGLEYFLNDYSYPCDTVKAKLALLPESIPNDVSGCFYTVNGSELLDA